MRRESSRLQNFLRHLNKFGGGGGSHEQQKESAEGPASDDRKKKPGGRRKLRSQSFNLKSSSRGDGQNTKKSSREEPTYYKVEYNTSPRRLGASSSPELVVAAAEGGEEEERSPKLTVKELDLSNSPIMPPKLTVRPRPTLQKTQSFSGGLRPLVSSYHTPRPRMGTALTRVEELSGGHRLYQQNGAQVRRPTAIRRSASSVSEASLYVPQIRRPAGSNNAGIYDGQER